MNIDEHERRITGSTWFDGCETVKSYISKHFSGGVIFVSWTTGIAVKFNDSFIRFIKSFIYYNMVLYCHGLF